MDTLEIKYSKEEFNTWYEKFKLPAMLKLTEEEKRAIMPNVYMNNQEQGHQALCVFAQNVVNLVQQNKLINCDNEKTIVCQFAEYMINLRYGSVGLKTVEVIDEMTAKNYANSLLSNEERNLLQKGTYSTNKEKALCVLKKFAELTYEQLVLKNLQENRTEKDFVTNFIKEKIMELDILSEN